MRHKIFSHISVVALFSAVSTATLANTAGPMGCGTVTSTGTGNSTPLVIDGFPCKAGGYEDFNNAAMVPYISIKICAPGSTTNCQVIDHIIADTGSTGLRVASTALNSKLKAGVAGGLPVVAGSTSGTVLTQCETYIDSFVYGPVVKADIYIADEFVKNTEVQVFGDPNFRVAKDCKSQGGTDTNTTADFGGNGLIGIGFDLTDYYALYYNCKGTKNKNCSNRDDYKGILNTVTQFPVDNNGVVMTLPNVGAAGSIAPVVGTLNFGVSTQANNTPSSDTVGIKNLGGESDLSGTFATQLGGKWFPAYIDSGTDVAYFTDKSNNNLKVCKDDDDYFNEWYCPPSPQTVSFIFADTGKRIPLKTVTLPVANAVSVAKDPVVAYNNVAGPTDGSTSSPVEFGLSLFLGHDIYVLFNDKQAPGTGLGGTAGTTVTGPVNGFK